MDAIFLVSVVSLFLLESDMCLSVESNFPKLFFSSQKVLWWRLSNLLLYWLKCHFIRSSDQWAEEHVYHFYGYKKVCTWTNTPKSV